MTDIQSIGMVIMLFPILSMLLLLLFALVQLASAVRLQRKASQPNAYVRNRARRNLR